MGKEQQKKSVGGTISGNNKGTKFKNNYLLRFKLLQSCVILICWVKSTWATGEWRRSKYSQPSPHITVSNRKKKEKGTIKCPGLVSWFGNRWERFLQGGKALFNFTQTVYHNSLLLITQAMTIHLLALEICIALETQHSLAALLMIICTLTSYT